MDYSLYKPENETELKNYIKLFAGIELPDVQIMPNAISTPFRFVSDIYFRRSLDLLLIAGRDSGKTTNVSLASWLAAKFNPNLEVDLVGSIASQAKRAYSYVSSWAPKYSDCLYSHMSETKFKNNSVIQILSGTVNGLNSPHPNLGILDEFELFDQKRFEEFELTLHSGDNFEAIEVLLTSLKYPNGIAVRTLEDAGYSLTSEGVIQVSPHPKRKLYLWTSFDVAERCNEPNCNKCKALKHDGRSFYDVCQGRLRKAKGFVKIQDLKRKFMKLDKSTFDAQVLAKKPRMEGLIYPWFEKSIENFEIEPLIKTAQIVGGIDFGGYPDPNVLISMAYKPPHIFLFDEIYSRKYTPSTFMQAILERQKKFHISKQILFADPSGKSFWREGRNYGLRFYPPMMRGIEEGINYINSIGNSGYIHIHPSLRNTIFEAQGYYRDARGIIHYLNGNHAMDASRYAIVSLSSLIGRVREV